MPGHKIMSAQTYQALTMMDGVVTSAGPFVFVSDGAIGVFPRFVAPNGTMIFLHAVAAAHPQYENEGTF